MLKTYMSEEMLHRICYVWNRGRESSKNVVEFTGIQIPAAKCIPSDDSEGICKMRSMNSLLKGRPFLLRDFFSNPTTCSKMNTCGFNMVTVEITLPFWPNVVANNG